jgi:glutamate racemase
MRCRLRALVDRGVKALVIACNTASAVALDALRAVLPLPFGVVDPGAEAACPSHGADASR